MKLHPAFHQLASTVIELNDACMNLNTIMADVGVEMKLKYDKYWGKIENINQLLYFGVVLDPRYKLRYVDWSFKDMYASEPLFAQNLSSSVKKNLFKMYDLYKENHDQQQCRVGQTSAGSSQIPTAGPIEIPTSLARADAFEQHLKEKDSIDKQNELERYLEEANIKIPNFDILLWWKQNSTRYPILSTMVRDVLASPVSTVASESAFNTGGRVLDTYRSSLNPEMAEALICTQNWVKSTIPPEKEMSLHEEFELSVNIVSGKN